ncbi:hypothetical protein BIV57_18535 [Mangrovactinospora gilvigrisea]|uniref:Uncharacterized protein n=1 Tax=Mangrovactinospora gilvigrisea TaxID=1428644 RepID=A0A1J7BBI9_9ACTN|nr:hypothetical protein [Mangrovactinospora gilvigrisea]OIV36019.1 hypothetical protein BIV57_18535 [Mangrovactinospora gilvigrisea]
MPVQADKSQRIINNAVKERQWRRSGKSRTTAAIVLAAFLVLGLFLVIKVYPGHPGDTAAPTCNGTVMSQGDQCQETVNGVPTHTYSYADMLAKQQATHPAAMVIGIIAIAIAVVFFVPAMRSLSPSKPWGTARPEPCPRCGRSELREKQITHTETHGRVRSTWRGIVTLCTAECGFTAVRKP